MKLLFNPDVTDNKCVRARPSDYLKSLPVEQQNAAVTEFPGWAENERRNSTDPLARVEAEIGVATAREFIQRLEESGPRIYTGSNGRTGDEQEN